MRRDALAHDAAVTAWLDGFLTRWTGGGRRRRPLAPRRLSRPVRRSARRLPPYRLPPSHRIPPMPSLRNAFVVCAIAALVLTLLAGSPGRPPSPCCW